MSLECGGQWSFHLNKVPTAVEWAVIWLDESMVNSHPFPKLVQVRADEKKLQMTQVLLCPGLPELQMVPVAR